MTIVKDSPRLYRLIIRRLFDDGEEDTLEEDEKQSTYFIVICVVDSCYRSLFP